MNPRIGGILSSDKRSKTGAARPRVWPRRLAWAALVLSILVVAGAVVAWQTQGSRIASELTTFLNRRVFDPDATRISVGRIGGFLPTGLTITDVRLDCRDPREGWFPFIAADTLRVRYRVFDIANGRYQATRLEASGLRFELRAEPEGSYVLPLVRGAGGTAGAAAAGGVAFGMDEVEVRNGSTRLDLPLLRLDVSDMSGGLSFAFRTGRVRLTFDGLEGAVRDSLGTLRVDSGLLDVHDGVDLSGLRGNWNGAPLAVWGHPTPDGDTPGDLRVEVSRFPLGLLGELLEQPNLSRGFVHTAAADFRMTPEEVGFTVTGDADWETWNLTGVRASGRITPRTVEVLEGSGTVDGARFTGARATIPVQDQDVTASAHFTGVDTDSLGFIPNIQDMNGTLQGRVAVRVPDRRKLTEFMSVRADLGAGTAYGVPFRSGFLEVAGGDAGWQVDSARVELDAGTAWSRGSLRPTDVNITFGYDGNLAPFAPLIRIEDFAARGSVRGRIHGPPENLRLESRGSLDDLRAFHMDFPRIDLRRAAGPLRAGRDVELDFIAPDPFTVYGKHVSFGSGLVHVTETSVDMDRLVLARGDTTLTITGRLQWEPHVMLDMESASVGLGAKQFTLREPARLDIDGSRLSTPGLTVVTPRGTVDAAGSYDRDVGDMAVRLGLHDLVPDSLGLTGPDFPLHVGHADGSLDLRGTIPVIDGAGDLRLTDVAWGTDVHIDTLNTRLSVDGRTINVDSVHARRGRGVLDASGRVRMGAPLYDVFEAEVFGPDLDPDSTLWNLSATVSDIVLDDWLGFMPNVQRPRGTLDGRLQVAGTSAHPEVGVEAALRGLVWRQYRADSILVAVHDADSAAVFQSLEIWERGQPVRLKGSLPVELAFKPMRFAVGREGLDVQVGADLGALQALKLTPWVDEAEGSFTGTLKATGDPRRPLLSGEIRVQADRVAIRGRDEVLEDVEGLVVADGHLIKIPAASARLGGGLVTAQGTYRLFASELDSYEMHIQAKKAVVRERNRYAARVDADLTLRPTLGSDGRIYPFAEGKVVADRVEYVGTLQPRDIQEFRPQPILYDVDIEAPGRIFVDTEDVRAELSATVNVSQDVATRVIQGEVDVLSGTYRLFLRRFNIVAGTLTWQDPTTQLPYVDLTAETYEGKYLISVTVTGRVDETVLQFAARDRESGEDSALSEQEILRYLAVGAVDPTTASDDLPGAGLVRGSMYFLGDVERALLDRIGFIDEIQINPEYRGSSGDQGGGFDVRFEVRKWLTPELSLRYEQGLNRFYGQAIGLEYRLRRALILRAESVQGRERPNETSVTQEYNLDLKLRHEY